MRKVSILKASSKRCNEMHDIDGGLVRFSEHYYHAMRRPYSLKGPKIATVLCIL